MVLHYKTYKQKKTHATKVSGDGYGGWWWTVVMMVVYGGWCWW
jgi:hypothetical protein